MFAATSRDIPPSTGLEGREAPLSWQRRRRLNELPNVNVIDPSKATMTLNIVVLVMRRNTQQLRKTSTSTGFRHTAILRNVLRMQSACECT
ncbi:hypothetical protein GJ744_000096 [Endocarpon pusillum]|uniref:Uncharacterized protein n=1 Tax=Endocarpon pusillum TaxID=364733 RepID=A0A8H7AWM8_9EURO|nr:hypothetical protein GJ744_000096 [Endocarpon pusillum]